jgi:hypothetical protein
MQNHRAFLFTMSSFVSAAQVEELRKGKPEDEPDLAKLEKPIKY